MSNVRPRRKPALLQAKRPVSLLLSTGSRPWFRPPSCSTAAHAKLRRGCASQPGSTPRTIEITFQSAVALQAPPRVNVGQFVGAGAVAPAKLGAHVTMVPSSWFRSRRRGHQQVTSSPRRGLTLPSKGRPTAGHTASLRHGQPRRWPPLMSNVRRPQRDGSSFRRECRDPSLRLGSAGLPQPCASSWRRAVKTRPTGCPSRLRWRSANRRRCSKHVALASTPKSCRNCTTTAANTKGRYSHHRAIRWAINVTILSRSYKGAATVLHPVAP